MRWVWDNAKDRTNRRVHRLSFATAALIFDDPLAVSRPDEHPDGDCWQTIGMVGQVILFVVHTAPDQDGEDESVGRIISARKATAHERRAYENGAF